MLKTKLLIKVIHWILLSFKWESKSIPVQHLVILVEKLSKVQKSRGTLYLITYIKAIRANFLNYLSGNPKRDPLSACTVDGIPKALGGLIPLVRGKSYLAITMILTILMSTRSLKLKPTPNLDTIIAPFSGDTKQYAMFAGDF